jgi:hypothetical protein
MRDIRYGLKPVRTNRNLFDRFGVSADLIKGRVRCPLYPRKRVNIRPQLFHAYKALKYLYKISLIKTVIPTIYEICIGRVSQHVKSA